MVDLNFHKYQGTGNDFVIVDNRYLEWNPDKHQIQSICNRKFGVGADGLILIQNHNEVDFEMIYYNSDGTKSLCGNGSRCAIHFAHSLGLNNKNTRFETTDGIHHGSLNGDYINFEVFDVDRFDVSATMEYFINTGSPHVVIFEEAIKKIDIVSEGRKIRFAEKYQPDGTNVNFVELIDDHNIAVRTYERGVEDETLSCGTGVTASALVATSHGLKSPVTVQTKGGKLGVTFDRDNSGFKNIILSGSVRKVFEGKIEI